MKSADRKQKVEELLESMHSLKRGMSFRTAVSGKGPRITPSQWTVLMLIGHAGHDAQCTVKDVAEALSITSSAATQLVDGLVKSGYVVKSTDPKDRRVVVLSLSTKSKKHVTALRERAVKRFLQVFSALNDREFAQYCTLNKKIIQGLYANKTT